MTKQEWEEIKRQKNAEEQKAKQAKKHEKISNDAIKAVSQITPLLLSEIIELYNHNDLNKAIDKVKAEKKIGWIFASDIVCSIKYVSLW